MALNGKDKNIVAKVLTISGDIMALMGEYIKALFFYNQCLLYIKLVSNLNQHKSVVLTKIADILCHIKDHAHAIRVYKRALLYIWYHDKSEQEIEIYDKMGNTSWLAARRAKYAN